MNILGVGQWDPFWEREYLVEKLGIREETSSEGAYGLFNRRIYKVVQ